MVKHACLACSVKQRTPMKFVVIILYEWFLFMVILSKIIFTAVSIKKTEQMNSKVKYMNFIL
ncbi:hypothetical protein D1164_20180 [Mariniphaga sediminis]|uniref:Uncharacterized protein n=1 Tax=Mariniphaga sediminis TaxID=1628158 RepID=A0A399CZ10_9BACT|nr:hypothetical protein D1164_20180 [Mariniphaga sediminis]